MKKTILLLLLSITGFAQQTNFPYGIKNPAATVEVSPTMLTTHGATNVYGKVSVNNLPVSIATQDSLNKKLNVSDVPSNLTLYATNVAADIGGYFKLVNSIDDPDYNATAVDISTGSITTTSQLISSSVAPIGLVTGQPGVINVTTIGNIKRVSGTGTASFYFQIFHRTSGGVETLIGTSSATLAVSSSTYQEFFTTAIWNDGTFLPTDRVVIKFYANRIAGNSDPTYNFQFGGAMPVRSIVPVPFSVVAGEYELNTNKQNSLALDGTGKKYTTVDAVNAEVVKLTGNQTIAGLKEFTDGININSTVNELFQINKSGVKYAHMIVDNVSNIKGFGLFGSYFALENTSLTIDPQLRIENSPTNAFATIQAYSSINPLTKHSLYLLASGDVYIRANNNDRITLEGGSFYFKTGNLLVNTTTDDGVNKLQVNGTISALPATLSNQVVVKSQLDLKQDIITNPISGIGITGQVSFWNGTSTQTGDSGLFWDNTNKRLGIGTILPTAKLQSNTTDGVGLKITGTSKDGSTDNTEGVSIVLTHNAVGNRQFFIGGSDTNTGIRISGLTLGGFTPTTGLENTLTLNPNMSRVVIGSSFGYGNNLNISNVGGNISNTILGIQGDVGQTGNYMHIAEQGGSSKFILKANGNLLMNTTTDNGIDKLQVPNGTISALPATLSNQVVVKSQLDLKSDLASPTLTGTPTAPTAVAGTNTTQIATTAFVQDSKKYKSYIAILNQLTTNAPTATVVLNELSGSIVWTYSTVGGYIGTLTGAFTNNKTVVMITNGQASNSLFGGYRATDNAVIITNATASTGVAVDGVLWNASVEIRVYN